MARRSASTISRRTLLAGSAATGVLALGSGLVVASQRPGQPVTATSAAVRRAEVARQGAGQKTVAAHLSPRPATVDLGGLTVQTWAYDDGVPGPLLRATAGDLLSVGVANSLGESTSVHWHGVALRNDMDGVPGTTQAPIAAGGEFTYAFTVPDPGTYFYHPHSGLQLDRGLYGVLVVDDPHEPGDYDLEWVVVLDDWVDGTGRTPDDVLATLEQGSGQGMGGMGGGMMGGAGGQSDLLGDAGDVDYPHYLVNGRVPAAPVTLRGKPGQKVRIRLVNAGSDTAFRVALGGHRLTVTHSDGYPVQPSTVDAVVLGMGERYDVLVTLGDGAFPLVAQAEGKQGRGLALVRTASGQAPSATTAVAELGGTTLLGTDLRATSEVRLASRTVDTSHDLVFGGSMGTYRWTINGRTFEDAEPLGVRAGERVRLRLRNATMMFHPIHLHGHTFGLVRGGARKDTVIVPPMRQVDVELQADNPGQWVTHCHNAYHMAAGMMTTLSYQA
ncbi:MAG: multicopper oxidase family protein [Pedococcus sp.]